MSLNQKSTPNDATTRASRKTDKSAQTRQKLVREALQVISEKGVADTSVLEIAQQLGISHGTFYYHFQNMDHLLEEVGHNVVQSLIAKIRSVRREDQAAQLARGPLIIHHYAKEHPQLRTIILRVVVDLEGKHADIKDGLRVDIARGKDTGRFRSEDIDLTVEFCARLVSAMLRMTEGSPDADNRAKLTAIDTLILLGVPLAEAREVVEQELVVLENELANLDEEVLAG